MKCQKCGHYMEIGTGHVCPASGTSDRNLFMGPDSSDFIGEHPGTVPDAPPAKIEHSSFGDYLDVPQRSGDELGLWLILDGISGYRVPHGDGMEYARLLHQFYVKRAPKADRGVFILRFSQKDLVEVTSLLSEVPDAPPDPAPKLSDITEDGWMQPTPLVPEIPVPDEETAKRWNDACEQGERLAHEVFSTPEEEAVLHMAALLGREHYQTHPSADIFDACLSSARHAYFARRADKNREIERLKGLLIRCLTQDIAPTLRKAIDAALGESHQ